MGLKKTNFPEIEKIETMHFRMSHISCDMLFLKGHQTQNMDDDRE